uniref:DNA ligase n=1 Tax=Geladintestivirus 2 TaxID=3233134 RepID=A0AAU8MI45_9CAUD
MHNNGLYVRYGLLGSTGRIEEVKTNRKIKDEYESLIKSKRKEGYKTITDLYDNAPEILPEGNLYNYLNNYLPKFNTHENGAFIPMLCKTLEDNKPFEKGSYFGQWKINGERCIITVKEETGLFGEIKLNYRSREGIDWTSKLSYLDEAILSKIPNALLYMMIEEGVGLDGELYLPGYGINEINSFIKNTELPQHYKLQFWCYDLCIDEMSADNRQSLLHYYCDDYYSKIITKEDHLNNKARFVVLPNEAVSNIQEAIICRDKFIDLGFEGLVIRECNSSYQFGGKRNNAMLKFKKKLDGKFRIIDIISEGKRKNLPKFICQNDINDSTFTCTLNATHKVQEEIFINKNNYVGKLGLIEYFERSGIHQLPFHAKMIKIIE